MKSYILVLLLFVLAGCGGKPPVVVIPANSDLKTDVLIKTGEGPRTIEVTFYFSKPVAPGVKTGTPIQVIAVEDPTFNGEPLVAATNAAGQPVYSGENLQTKPENLVSAKLNGKEYEGKLITQTTLPNKSATAVMSPK